MPEQRQEVRSRSGARFGWLLHNLAVGQHLLQVGDACVGNLGLPEDKKREIGQSLELLALPASLGNPLRDLRTKRPWKSRS